jgi:putative membrane protein
MPRAISTANTNIPEGIEAEMSSYGWSSESELRGVHRPPFYQTDGRGKDIAKGALAGAIAGLVAGWVMVEFQKAWSKVSEAAEQRRDSRSKSLHEHGVPEHRAVNPEGDQEEQPDDATVKTAELISETVFRHRLSREEKKVAGPAVHYAFAVGAGALYGALAEISPEVEKGYGTAFGAALFVAADEIAVPALGLSPNVQQFDFSKHVYGFASHLVYGAATEAARRPIRRALAA